MSKYMTKADALKMWRQDIKPIVVQFHGKGDSIALRESWNDFVDTLAKHNQISWHQADTWSQPSECA